MAVVNRFNLQVLIDTFESSNPIASMQIQKILCQSRLFPSWVSVFVLFAALFVFYETTLVYPRWQVKKISVFHEIVDDESSLVALSRSRSLVYNKPPKTGGTKLQFDMLQWGKQNEGTPVIFCSTYAINFNIRDCLNAVKRSPTYVFANHIIMDDSSIKALQDLMGSFSTVTSTRRAGERMLSEYLQVNAVKLSSQNSSLDDEEENMKTWFSNRSAWYMFNFHTGEKRQGACPITPSDVHDIWSLAKKYDFVLDLERREHSVKVLEHLFGENIFSSRVINVRNEGSYSNVSNTVKMMMKKSSCVEEELDRALQYRLSSFLTHQKLVDCVRDKNDPYSDDRCYSPDLILGP